MQRVGPQEVEEAAASELPDPPDVEEGDCGDEDEDEDDEPDESEQNEPGIPSGSDPRSDRTFLLPSLFVGRPDTVWFDYPPYMGVMRQEGRSTISELTEKRLRPLWFKSDRNINCITNAFKRSGFRRLIKGTSYNLYWGKHLNEKAMRALGPHQVAFSPPRLSRSVAAPRAHTPRRARAARTRALTASPPASAQWVNHFPGSYGLGRKDNLWKNMSRMLRQHGPAYDFSAKSYLLPRDREVR